MKKCGIISENSFSNIFISKTEENMELVIGASRYIFPLITLIILIKCMLSLLFGHPKEKTYGYIIDAVDGERYPLNMWETSIGRSNSCDVVIGYDTVSRFQAVISRRIDGWYIYDLLSKSGILVNGEKIEKKAMISGGDTLTFGNVQYRFEIADDPVQLVGKKKGKIKNQKPPITYAERPAQASSPSAPTAARPPRKTPPQGSQADLYFDSEKGTYNLDGFDLSKNAGATYSTNYYDDEHRPTLHFEKKKDSIFTQMQPENGSKDVFSNRADRKSEGSEVIVTPNRSEGERRYTIRRPSLFNRSTGETFVLSGNRVVIGRGRGADIQLSSPTVSRKHAVLVLYEDGWAIEDCGSSAGTYLSGNKVTEPQLLFDGDVITLGDEKLYYTYKNGVN